MEDRPTEGMTVKTPAGETLASDDFDEQPRYTVTAVMRDGMGTRTEHTLDDARRSVSALSQTLRHMHVGEKITVERIA